MLVMLFVMTLFVMMLIVMTLFVMTLFVMMLFVMTLFVMTLFVVEAGRRRHIKHLLRSEWLNRLVEGGSETGQVHDQICFLQHHNVARRELEVV